VVRTAGLWMGRGRRFIANVKADIDREIKADELKEILEKQTQKANPMHEIIEETRQDLNQIKQDAEKHAQAGRDAIESHDTAPQQKTTGSARD
jgi:sec-independent protein translocase protein TatB